MTTSTNSEIGTAEFPAAVVAHLRDLAAAGLLYDGRALRWLPLIAGCPGCGYWGMAEIFDPLGEECAPGCPACLAPVPLPGLRWIERDPTDHRPLRWIVGRDGTDLAAHASPLCPLPVDAA